VTIWRMRTVCRLPKATDPYTSCVIFIVFPLQQWLHERTSALRYSTLRALFFSFSTIVAGKSFLLRYKRCDVYIASRNTRRSSCEVAIVVRLKKKRLGKVKVNLSFTSRKRRAVEHWIP